MSPSAGPAAIGSSTRGPQRGAAPHRRRRRRLPPDRHPGPEGSIGKLAVAELEQRVRELHLDLLGPAGMLYTTDAMTRPECSVSDSPHRSFLRSRATTIEGGTSEVMRNILGERVPGLPPEPSCAATATCRGRRSTVLTITPSSIDRRFPMPIQRSVPATGKTAAP